MITLWRVDALHDLGGEASHFFEDQAEALAAVEQFRVWGWYADGYAESIDRAPPETLYLLCNRLHPNAPTPSLLALCWIESREEFNQTYPAEQMAEHLEGLFDAMDAELGFRPRPVVSATEHGGPSS